MLSKDKLFSLSKHHCAYDDFRFNILFSKVEVMPLASFIDR